MKIIMILLIMICNSAIAKEYNFDQISTEPDFDIRFNLKNSLAPSELGVLDCQSFIKKFDFYDESGNLEQENIINMNQCEYLYNQVVNCFGDNKPKCFDSEDLFKDSCLCN